MAASRALAPEKSAYIRDNWTKMTALDIARALGLSEGTVQQHGRLVLKLGNKRR